VAFGADFALTIPETTRIDAIPAEAPPARGGLPDHAQRVAGGGAGRAETASG
jgi:hypothetical protein